MRIAIIDSCSTTLELYKEFISSETGARVDGFQNPLHFFVNRKGKYDIVISDFYFENVNLDFYWDYLDHKKLIILTSNKLGGRQFECMGVYKTYDTYAKFNIISIIKLSRPSLRLIQEGLNGPSAEDPV